MENIENFKNVEEKHSTVYQYRRVHGIMGEHSFSVVLPKLYALNIGVGKGDSVKVTLDSKRIILEKA